MVSFTGSFEIFDAHISHKLLLLRKAEIKNGKFINTDIIFHSVYYMEIPNYFIDLTIEEGNEEDRKYIESRFFDETFWQFFKVFVLTTKGHKYYIYATKYEVQDNELGAFETSIPWPK